MVLRMDQAVLSHFYPGCIGFGLDDYYNGENVVQVPVCLDASWDELYTSITNIVYYYDRLLPLQVMIGMCLLHSFGRCYSDIPYVTYRLFHPDCGSMAIPFIFFPIAVYI